MAIWAGMLGFLFSLYATVEIIQTVRISNFSEKIAATATALKAHNASYNAYSQLARGMEPEASGKTVLLALGEIRDATKDEGIAKAAVDMAKAATALVPLALIHPERPKALQELVHARSEIEKHLIARVTESQEALAEMISHDRKNKILIVLLSMCVLGHILFLE
ncbi:MAG: hypothetical protein AB7O46_07845 [Xanthobacteraceae bacterium]